MSLILCFHSVSDVAYSKVEQHRTGQINQRDKIVDEMHLSSQILQFLLDSIVVHQQFSDATILGNAVQLSITASSIGLADNKQNERMNTGKKSQRSLLGPI